MEVSSCPHTRHWFELLWFMVGMMSLTCYSSLHSHGCDPVVRRRCRIGKLQRQGVNGNSFVDNIVVTCINVRLVLVRWSVFEKSLIWIFSKPVTSQHLRLGRGVPMYYTHSSPVCFRSHVIGGEPIAFNRAQILTPSFYWELHRKTQ